jgi:hypothetical protein
VVQERLGELGRVDGPVLFFGGVVFFGLERASFVGVGVGVGVVVGVVGVGAPKTTHALVDVSSAMRAKRIVALAVDLWSTSDRARSTSGLSRDRDRAAVAPLSEEGKSTNQRENTRPPD